MSKYASNNEARRKNKNSKSNLNISDSNDFWNDCQAEEKLMHKQNHPNSQIKNNVNTINRQPSQQSSLFNKNNSKNNPIKINITKTNPIAYKTSTISNKEKEKEKLKFSNKNLNSNFSEINKTPSKGANTNVYTVSNTNPNYYLTSSEKNNNKINLNYANTPISNKILNNGDDKIGTPKTERSLNPSFSNNSYKSINSQEPSTIRKDPFSFKNLEKFLNTKYNTESDKSNVYDFVDKNMNMEIIKTPLKENIFRKVSAEEKKTPYKNENFIQKIPADEKKTPIKKEIFLHKISGDEKNRFDSLYNNAKMKNQYLQKLIDDRKKLEDMKAAKENVLQKPKANYNSTRRVGDGPSEYQSHQSLYNPSKFDQKNQKDITEKSPNDEKSFIKSNTNMNNKIEKVSINQNQNQMQSNTPSKESSKLKTIEANKIEEYKFKIYENNKNFSEILEFEDEICIHETNSQKSLHKQNQRSVSYDITHNTKDKNQINPNIDLINFEFDSDSELADFEAGIQKKRRNTNF